ncbi:hypothetical protein BJF78_34745 [Pseudonocardia sp. CNS-139]|nr:hypothetical protein BJF78_34745 [Pseudonocardia sp. CNS-139]
MVAELATEHDELADPAGHQARLARWTEAKQAAEGLRSATAGWAQTLNDRVGDMASTVDLDIGVRLRAVRKDAADRFAETDPSRGWVDLEPWLYQRTNEALTDHYLLIRQQADVVADAVAARFADGADAAAADVAGVLTGGTVAGQESGLAALAASRASKVELAIAAARGGAAGMLVLHAVALVGLAVPVTLPIAAVLTGLLARRTWKTAKTAQLRALRAEADRVVAAYLEEVEMLARKDTRDAVRRVQQYLRETYAAHAAERQASAARNLEVIARAVRDAELSGRKRVAEVAAELERVRALAERAERAVAELTGEGVRVS